MRSLLGIIIRFDKNAISIMFRLFFLSFRRTKVKEYELRTFVRRVFLIDIGNLGTRYRYFTLGIYRALAFTSLMSSEALRASLDILSILSPPFSGLPLTGRHVLIILPCSHQCLVAWGWHNDPA